jgi:hypothetical protein
MRIETTVNNSLLNLNFEEWTKAIAFADDLLIVVKATVVEVENFTIMEMSKMIQRKQNLF